MSVPYYYSRLNKSEKKIYEQIYHGLCSYSARIEISKIPGKSVVRIYADVLNDHPEISIVDCTAVNYESGLTRLQLLPGYWFDENEVYINHMQFLQECENIANTIANPSMTDFEKELAVHDYICRNISYGYCNVPGMEQKLSQSAFSTLFERRGVCKGISMLFKCLMDLMGVETIVVEGEALSDTGWGGHTWNMVRLNGAYTQADLTYDIMAYHSHGRISYFRTNFTDEEARGNYKWNYRQLPACNVSSNGYYELSGLVAANDLQLQNIVKRLLAQGICSFSLKIQRGSELSCKTEDMIGNDIARYASLCLDRAVQIRYMLEDSMKRMLVEIQ